MARCVIREVASCIFGIEKRLWIVEAVYMLHKFGISGPCTAFLVEYGNKSVVWRERDANPDTELFIARTAAHNVVNGRIKSMVRVVNR